MSKTTALNEDDDFSTFALHNYDVKPPNAASYGGHEHTATTFPLSFLTWIKSLRIQLYEKSLTFDKLNGMEIDSMKIERTQIHFFSDLFIDVVVVVVVS